MNSSIKKQIIYQFVLIISMVSFTMTGFTQSYSKTNYEKKIESLEIEFLTDLGFSQRELNEFKHSSLKKKEVLLQLAGVAALTTKKGEAALANLLDGYKKAESLKTDEDIKKELKKKQEKVANEARKKQEKVAIEARKKRETAANEAREKRETAILEAKWAILNFERSDKGHIQKQVTTLLSSWLLKGEFERQEEYDKRIQNESKNQFEIISTQAIKNQIGKVGYVSVELGKFNPDEEYFDVSFSINNYSNGKRLTWQNKLEIPLSRAEDFKENWKVKWLKNEYEYCFIDNQLYPSIITVANVNNQEEYNFKQLIPNQQEITIKFDDLEITNSSLKGIIYCYSDEKKRSQELATKKAIEDSLAYVSYSIEYDSLLDALNDSLLTSKFNTEKIGLSMDKNKKVHKNNVSNKNSFQNSLNKLYKTYNQNVKQIEGDYYRKQDLAYRNNSSYFKNKEEFISYYIQGDSLLTIEVETRRLQMEEDEVISKLKESASVIKELNFKNVNNPSKGKIGQDLASAGGYNVNTEGIKQSRNVVKFMSVYKNKPYYNTVVKKLIQINTNLTKSWNKEGTYFSNEKEFYEAYISGKYKSKLKMKKKGQ